MIRRVLAGPGYWIAATVAAIAIGLVAGVAIINLALPGLDHGSAVASSTPAPSSGSPGTSPVTSGGIDMGGAIIPEDARCTGCHAASPGIIDRPKIPVMGHPLEGWSRCTDCHAPERLVDTAPGHSGIHANQCTVCHQPGDLPAPMSRPHRLNQNVACLSCHGSTAPLPTDMTHRKEGVCWLCHRLPTIEPPVPAHQTATGETDCRACHVAGGAAGALPSDHLDRSASVCLACHEVTLGIAPADTPRIVVWPAPSPTVVPSLSPPGP